jgi:hypothetical protein
VAILFSNPEMANAGFSMTGPPWTWPAVDGQHFASDYLMDGSPQLGSDLARLIRAAYDALPDVDQPWPIPCPPAIPWEDCPPETLVPEDAPMFFERGVCPELPDPDAGSGEPDAGPDAALAPDATR